MITTPQVSVCVITYNHGEWLRECLQSIVDQETSFDYEIIVGDDCSTDNLTKEILKDFSREHPSKVVPLFREKNMGGGGTQNWLDVMRRARGEYIAHIDGDDRMLPGKLQKQADFLYVHPECAFVAHDLRTFDSVTGATLSNSFGGRFPPEIADIDYLLVHRCYFGHSSKMFRRSAMITLERDQPTVDFFMHIEHASRGKIGYIHETLGEYRKSSQSATNPAGKGFQSIVDGYEDAFKRAIELGVERNVVTAGRLCFRYSMALHCLDVFDKERFSNYIRIATSEWRYATWKHRLLSAFANSPGIARYLIRLYRLMSDARMLFRMKVGGAGAAR